MEDANNGSTVDGRQVKTTGQRLFNSPPKDVDQAYNYLQNVNISQDEIAAVDLKKCRSRVDWRIVPIMLLSYTFFFIDRVLLNYANVMGLSKDIALQGNNFSNSSSAMSFAHLASQVVHGYALNKLPAARYMAVNIILWGITTAGTAGVTDFPTLIVSRVFLGAFEGAIAPCVTLLLSQWYTKEQQATRFGGYFLGLGVGQIIGGLLSYAFQHVESSTLAGWRIMFLFAGLLTILDGVAAWILIPDSPMKAKFLSEPEKVAMLQQVSKNLTGVVNRRFKASQLWEIVTDVQIWIFTCMTILTCIPSGVISVYSATLIRGFGYSPKAAALLNLPSGAVAIIATILASVAVRYTSVRSPWVIACCIPGVIGGALLSFLPDTNKGGLLMGIYLISSVVPVLPITYQWVAANIAGHTKRPFSVSLVAGAYGVGAIIGPQTFQAKDAPRYLPAKYTVMGVQAGGALCAILLFAYYTTMNMYRNKKYGKPDGSIEAEGEKGWVNLTDKENTAFRYVY